MTATALSGAIGGEHRRGWRDAILRRKVLSERLDGERATESG